MPSKENFKTNKTATTTKAIFHYDNYLIKKIQILKPLKNTDSKMIIISEKRRYFPHESCVGTLILKPVCQEDKDTHTDTYTHILLIFLFEIYDIIFDQLFLSIKHISFLLLIGGR